MPSRAERHSGRSRARILKAARAELSERGYGGATVRAIAERAEVSDALVYHHFRSRHGVLAAALTDAARVLGPAGGAGGRSTGPAGSTGAAETAGPAGPTGEELVREVLPRWESPERRDAVLAVIRSSLTQPAAARLLLDGLVSPECLGVPRGTAPAPHGWCPHAVMIGAQLVGVMTARHIIRVEPLASAALDQLTEQVGPVLQRYLTDHARAGCAPAATSSPE